MNDQSNNESEPECLCVEYGRFKGLGEPVDLHIVYSPGQVDAAVYYKGHKVYAKHTEEVHEHVLEWLGVETTYDVPLTLPGGSGSWGEVPSDLDVVLARKTD